MITVLRPLSTSELLDRTFHLYRNHFLMFATITAISQIPVLALHMADSNLWLRSLIATRGLRMLLFVVVSFLGLEVAHAATAVAVSRLHLGGSTSIRSAYSAAKGSLFRVIWIVFVTFILPLAISVGLGVLAVGVSAGILGAVGMFGAGDATTVGLRVAVVFLAAPLLASRWLLAWSLVVPVTVLEGGGLRATMRRSRTLTAGRRGRIFGIYLLIFLLTYAVGILFQTPYFILAGVGVFSRHVNHGSLTIIVSAVGSFLSTSFVGPLLEIAFTLIYYDERVRKEGFDLQLMMSNLEGGVPNIAAAVPAS
jgi:hypothetical protein